MLDFIETRLKKPSNIFSSLESAMEFANFKDKNVTKDKMAYLVLIEEKPANQEQDSASIWGDTKVTFALVIGIQSRNDSKGSKGINKVDAVRKQLNERLVGFLPESATKPVVFSGGKLLAMVQGSGLWWIDTFSFIRFSQATITT